MWVIIAILILLATYLFLISPRIFGKPDRTFLYGVYYAHRGLFDNETCAPENSIAAIRKAVEAGYGIEFDVQLSKDDVPVVFHDASLKRMCGVDGKVWEYTIEQLQKMKIGKSNETIPTLAHVLEIIDGRVPLIIEYKLDRAISKVCELGNKVLENYQGAYCIECFHPLALMWYRKNRPEIIRGQLSQDYSKTKYKGVQYWFMTHLLTNFLTRPDFIAYNYKGGRKLSRRICQKLGALSVAWTVRSQEQYEIAKPYFDLFIFDSFIL